MFQKRMRHSVACFALLAVVAACLAAFGAHVGVLPAAQAHLRRSSWGQGSLRAICRSTRSSNSGCAAAHGGSSGAGGGQQGMADQAALHCAAAQRSAQVDSDRAARAGECTRVGCCRHATASGQRTPRGACSRCHCCRHTPGLSCLPGSILHVQGDSGIGWAFLPKLLAEDLPHTQWVLPNAPVVRPLAACTTPQRLHANVTVHPCPASWQAVPAALFPGGDMSDTCELLLNLVP